MKKRPYKPSPMFIAVCGGFCALAVFFFALPHLVLLAVKPPAELPPFVVSVDLKNKAIMPESTVSAALSPSILGAALYGIGGAAQSAASAIMATRVYDVVLGSAAPESVTITPGMRKEQVAGVLASSLGWDASQKQIFLDMTTEADGEGALYPSTYILHASSTPAEAYEAIKERFSARVGARYTAEVAEAVPMEDALRIASIIEREAGVGEMRLISGILWNRLFADMRLQADSTLQYVRGTAKNGWWPTPRSRDKFIKSPYNTYLNEGLPPTPIASPSVAAIAAALNPEKTDCFYFFHAKGELHCSVTYEEHVKKLKAIYGRGR